MFPSLTVSNALAWYLDCQSDLRQCDFFAMSTGLLTRTHPYGILENWIYFSSFIEIFGAACKSYVCLGIWKSMMNIGLWCARAGLAKLLKVSLIILLTCKGTDALPNFGQHWIWSRTHGIASPMLCCILRLTAESSGLG